MATDAELIAEWESARGGGYVPQDDSSLIAEWNAANPTFAQEAEGVANRFQQGAGDVLGLVQELNIFSPGGPRLFGLNPLKPVPESEKITGGLKELGTLTDRQPQTDLGKVAGEIAYFAPNLALPGGLAKSAVASTLLAGTGAGIAKAADASEGIQAAASLAGAFAPNVWQAGKQIAGKLVGKPMENVGLALERSAAGARASDYNRTAENLGIRDIADGEVATLTKKSLDDAILSGELGKSRDPSKMLSIAIQQEKKITDQIGTAVRAAQEAQEAPVIPTFERAKKYITSGKVPASEIDRYLKEIGKLEESILTKGQGSLGFLQNQKVAWGSFYEQGNAAKNGFYQAVYHDLKTTLEKHVPGIKQLNEQERKWGKILKPIFQRSLGLEESSNIEKTGTALRRTSGGIGQLFAPAATIATGAGLATASPLIALGGGLALLSTPQGKRIAGQALLGAGKSLQEAQITLNNLPVIAEALSRAAEAKGFGDSQSTETDIAQRQEVQPTQEQEPPSIEAQSLLNRPQPETQIAPTGPAMPQQELRERALSIFQMSPQNLAQTARPQTQEKEPKQGYTSSNFAPSSYATQAPIDEAFKYLNSQGNSDMAENTYRAPPELIEAQIHQESRGKPDAVSPKGATGLMQIMPDTAKDIARELGVEKYDLKDPETSRQFGEYYLNKMINMFDGDLKLGLAAYNAGPGVVQKWIDKYNTYNWDEISVNLKREGKYKETRDYVPLILNRAKKLNPDFSEA